MGKQKDLPGVERALKDINDKAEEYADIRDQRMALTPKESALKAELLTLMKKHRLKTYKYNGIEVDVVTEEETVKVKIKAPAPEEGDE